MEKSEVPQGSILGLIQFTLYLNDQEEKTYGKRI